MSSYTTHDLGVNRSTTSTFASVIYEDVFQHGHNVSMLGIGGDGRVPRRCRSVAEVVSAAEELADQELNVYYPTTLVRADRQLKPGTRGTEAEMDALIGLHADLDLRGDAHPNATIPDVATALAIIDAFEMSPSCVVFTGHGIQAVWLFKEPLEIVTADDRRRAKLLVRRFVGTIAAIGRMNGGHVIDATGDLARVLRMPGTINRKVISDVALPPVPTKIIRPEPFDAEIVRYNPDDLEPWLVWLSEDDHAIDYSLVGSFKLDSAAAAPAIVRSQSQRSTTFAQLWNNDPAAKLNDHSSSGYRYAIMGHLVRAGATDQEIADAICAWYSIHDPAYEKHLRRPALILHEIAKQRTRSDKTQPTTANAPEARMPMPPNVEGPCGIRLIAAESKPTASKRRVRFEVEVEGQPAGEILVTDAGDSGQKACSHLDQILVDARGEDGHTDAQRDEVHKWLRGLATARQLDRVIEDLTKYQECSQASLAAPIKPTVHDLTVRFLMTTLGLAFREPGGLVWSEARASTLSRNDIMGYFPQELLQIIKGASNYAMPTASNPTKHIHHLQIEYKSIWSTIEKNLPTEIEAQQLGQSSMAAARLRDEICRIFETPEVWTKAASPGPEGRQVDRISLALRAQEIAASAHGQSRWLRIVRGADAFVRVELNTSGEPVVWLGMRATLCQGAVNKIRIPAIRNQHDLKVLMDRYGFSDQGAVSDRLHREDGQLRVCVLARQLTDRLLRGAGDDDEAPPSVTKLVGDSVTRDDDELDLVAHAGEVGHAG